MIERRKSISVATSIDTTFKGLQSISDELNQINATISTFKVRMNDLDQKLDILASKYDNLINS
jgi:hypothetical protein